GSGLHWGLLFPDVILPWKHQDRDRSVAWPYLEIPVVHADDVEILDIAKMADGAHLRALWIVDSDLRAHIPLVVVREHFDRSSLREKCFHFGALDVPLVVERNEE